MEFFKRKTHVNFLRIRKWSWTFSSVIVLICLLSIGMRGINWGLDFTGGYAIQVNYQQAPNLNDVRNSLKNAGLNHVDVVQFGSSHDLMLSLSPKDAIGLQTASTNSAQDALKTIVQNALGSGANIVEVNYTGSQVGAELAERGLLAILIALISIMIYIAMRFELRCALSAAITLAHDPIIIIGIFSIFQVRFDLTSLAAVLAVIGYSLNETIVIYDRVRENFRKLHQSDVAEVVNRAVNDTLSRTIMTASLTFTVVLILFLFGGPSIHNFSLALMIGIVVGTYSSIYISGGLAVLFGLNRAVFLPRVKAIDEMP